MKRVAETDTNAYDNAFTDFHALPFALRSSAPAGHLIPKDKGGRTNSRSRLQWRCARRQAAGCSTTQLADRCVDSHISSNRLSSDLHRHRRQYSDCLSRLRCVIAHHIQACGGIRYDLQSDLHLRVLRVLLNRTARPAPSMSPLRKVRRCLQCKRQARLLSITAR